jgi:hypothetical protein
MIRVAEEHGRWLAWVGEYRVPRPGAAVPRVSGQTSLARGVWTSAEAARACGAASVAELRPGRWIAWAADGKRLRLGQFAHPSREAAVAAALKFVDQSAAFDWPPDPCPGCAGRGVLERPLPGDACLDIIACPECSGPPAGQVQ